MSAVDPLRFHTYPRFINQTIRMSAGHGHGLPPSSEDQLRIDIGDATALVIDADNSY